MKRPPIGSAYDARKKVKRMRLVNAELMRKKWIEARDAKTANAPHGAGGAAGS